MIFTTPTIGIAMATESDWGRLYKFNGSGDAGIVMPPRSYYARNFFAGDWKDISLGFIHCTMGNTGDTSNIVAERLVEDAPVNLFHFGLTKIQGGSVPVATNPYFIGLRGIKGGITQIMTSPLQLAQLFATAGEVTDGPTIQMPLKQGVSGNPFAMIGIRLINNQTTGQISLSYNTQTDIALANDDANVTTLKTFLQNISTIPTAQFTNNNLEQLNSFFIYWPYLNNRLKLHCVGVVKNA